MATPRVTLRSNEFRRERVKSWRKLESLVRTVEREGLGALTPRQLTGLPAMHREVVSSLSVARSISLDRNLVEYLESLAARSYFCVYGNKRHLRSTVSDFFRRRFPAAVRRFRWHVALSALFLLLGGAVGFVQTLRYPEQYYDFISREYASGRDPTATTEELREVLYSGAEHGSDELSAFFTFLFSHNARIGILAFGLGFAAGLPVFGLLFRNGLVLGAMAALYHERGLSPEFWSWILPHGVTELLAVVLCGAAGLVLAQALIFPGRHSRLVNLALQGKQAGLIVLGAVVLFFLAALIEGYFRQLVHDIEVRYAVALVSALAWLAYFGLVGRREAA